MTVLHINVTKEEFLSAVNFLENLTRRVSVPAATHEEAARIFSHLRLSVVEEEVKPKEKVNVALDKNNIPPEVALLNSLLPE